MKLAIGSDLKNNLTHKVIELLEEQGHELTLFGALTNDEPMWSKVGEKVGKVVAKGICEQGILFCWTGTGVSIAANKVKGIRAALCNDGGTARGARLWNDANVLVMSLRLVSEPIAAEILNTWFSHSQSEDIEDRAGIEYLKKMDVE